MSEVWTKWQGHVIDGTFPLHRYLGGTDHSGVFLVELGGREPPEVAIKLVPVTTALGEAFLEHWDTAAGLDHPHLIRILQTGRWELDGLPFVYCVMEYSDQNLAQLLEHRAMSEDEAREMLPPVLSALSFLHNRNLVQGQLKPSNILVVGDQVKLASDTICRVSEVPGGVNTVSIYDPPEAGDGRSAAGDIWALGVTLFEALTRSPSLALDVRRGGVVLPSDFSPPFREVVSWCLSRRPFDRPKLSEIEARIRGTAEAGAVAAELSGAAAGGGVAEAASGTEVSEKVSADAAAVGEVVATERSARVTERLGEEIPSGKSRAAVGTDAGEPVPEAAMSGGEVAAVSEVPAVDVAEDAGEPIPEVVKSGGEIAAALTEQRPSGSEGTPVGLAKDSPTGADVPAVGEIVVDVAEPVEAAASADEESTVSEPVREPTATVPVETEDLPLAVAAPVPDKKAVEAAAVTVGAVPELAVLEDIQPPVAAPGSSSSTIATSAEIEEFFAPLDETDEIVGAVRPTGVMVGIVPGPGRVPSGGAAPGPNANAAPSVKPGQSGTVSGATSGAARAPVSHSTSVSGTYRAPGGASASTSASGTYRAPAAPAPQLGGPSLTARSGSAAGADRAGASPSTSTSGTYRSPVSPSTSASGTYRAPVSPSTSASGTYRAPVGPSGSAAGADRAGAGPSTSASGTYRAPVAPMGSAAGADRAGGSPSTSASGTYRSPVSPSTSASGTYRAPVNPSTSASGTYRVPANPSTSASGTYRSPVAPAPVARVPGPAGHPAPTPTSGGAHAAAGTPARPVTSGVPSPTQQNSTSASGTYRSPVGPTGPSTSATGTHRAPVRPAGPAVGAGGSGTSTSGTYRAPIAPVGLSGGAHRVPDRAVSEGPPNRVVGSTSASGTYRAPVAPVGLSGGAHRGTPGSATSASGIYRAPANPSTSASGIYRSPVAPAPAARVPGPAGQPVRPASVATSTSGIFRAPLAPAAPAAAKAEPKSPLPAQRQWTSSEQITVRLPTTEPAVLQRIIGQPVTVVPAAVNPLQAEEWRPDALPGESPADEPVLDQNAGRPSTTQRYLILLVLVAAVIVPLCWAGLGSFRSEHNKPPATPAPHVAPHKSTAVAAPIVRASEPAAAAETDAPAGTMQPGDAAMPAGSAPSVARSSGSAAGPGIPGRANPADGSRLSGSATPGGTRTPAGMGAAAAAGTSASASRAAEYSRGAGSSDTTNMSADSGGSATTGREHEEFPEIPPQIRKTIRGHVKVSVRVIIDQGGTVFAALVDTPGPSRYFDHMAIEAAKKWTFPPADSSSRLKLVRFDFTRDGTTGQAEELQ